MIKLFRYDADGPRLGVETEDGRFDLTGLAPEVFGTLAAWLARKDPVDDLRRAADRALEPVPDDCLLLPPVDLQEVWAAGVTYERSKVARMEESEGGGDFYDRVYIADRPELFLKAVGWRVVGPGQQVRVRKDSVWNVPEPELTLVLSSGGRIVGITIGNDVSSRSIEGENPLYLPQAKCYDGACALGPAVVPVGPTDDLRNRTIGLEIVRAGAVVFSEETTTARMKRSPEELAEYLFRETSFPHGALLMTGTGLVPPDTFTLTSGDMVHITIAGVGTLTNPVA
ncbi:MAG: fumarylacetoacetate hydrolase family protein [Capsulimonadales bacterium]|nr:fumarylacetoacetate hydrolase family protein [Capsulimonadales bacterium]